MSFPRVKVVLRPVEIWECGNPDHEHKSKAAAIGCIARGGDKSAPKGERSANAKERRYLIFINVHAGMSFSEVGKRFGITGSNARELFRSAIHRAKCEDDTIDYYKKNKDYCFEMVQNWYESK